jgi:hypothetical protein
LCTWRWNFTQRGCCNIFWTCPKVFEEIPKQYLIDLFGTQFISTTLEQNEGWWAVHSF